MEPEAHRIANPETHGTTRISRIVLDAESKSLYAATPRHPDPAEAMHSSSSGSGYRPQTATAWEEIENILRF